MDSAQPTHPAPPGETFHPSTDGGLYSAQKAEIGRLIALAVELGEELDS